MSSPGLPSTCPHCGASLGSPSGDAPAGSVREARTPDADETNAGLPADVTTGRASRPSSEVATGSRPALPPDHDEDVTSPGLPVAAVAGGRPTEDPDETRAGAPLPVIDPDETRAAMPPPVIDPDETRIGTPMPPPRPARASAGSTFLRGTRLGTPAPGATTGGATALADTASDLVGQQLGFRYQILKLLGAGGMGAVYQAWDEVLNVVVALKTIRPEIAADPETVRMLERRFKQELLLARRVTHKNIVRVHDMGDVGGIKYITMPFLEGEELSAILKREGKLAVPRAMKLARSVVSGLVAAHEVGVVHRDLKPANIMVDAQGEGLIMDFGVARSTGDPSTLTRDRGEGLAIAARELAGGQTQAGSVVGTVEYMAPEQARAQPVDQRADIYAFGLILYDVLLGRKRASHTKSAIEELTGRMAQAPASARTVDPAIPEALDRIIMRCVQPDAAARYQTIKDVQAELEALDDNGRPLPMVRRFTPAMMAASLALVATLLGFTWWLARSPAAPVEHEPVSVVISDFTNETGDATLDGTLEPVLKLALEEAGFISAYDRLGIRRSLGVRPPDVLDERAALELAVKQGLGVVLSGSVRRQGSRYAVSVKATQAVTGKVVANATNRTGSKEQVLAVATALADTVREALGDTTSDSAQRFATETLSATSLEAVHEYARGMEALASSQFEDALGNFSKAIEIDPKFGSAYGALAATSRNLGREQDAERYAKAAISHLDGMTERERYRARGYYYFLVNDYQACVKEYGDLVARYSADAAARNNRALCLTYLRDLPKAVDEMRQVVKILPNRALYRENLAQYLVYSGDFGAAEQEVRSLAQASLFGQLALGFTQLGRGQVPLAVETFEGLKKFGDEGASYAASGLGDIAIYEGRYSDATRILGGGADADLAGQEPDKAAAKLLALANAQLQLQQRNAAMASAEKALANSQAVKTRFLAGRVFVEAGAAQKAQSLAVGLASEIQAEPQAYAKNLQALAAMRDKAARRAITLLTDANALFDTWIGHFDLGRAYLEAGVFLQADSEFDRCIKRRGEALSLFLDEEPTSGYFPPVYYYQGRVREGLESSKVAESYRAYISLRGLSSEDPLLAEVRRRLAAAGGS